MCSDGLWNRISCEVHLVVALSALNVALQPLNLMLRSLPSRLMVPELMSLHSRDILMSSEFCTPPEVILIGLCFLPKINFLNAILTNQLLYLSKNTDLKSFIYF